jgi:transcriptional regulator of acetoin/glycerol metabolism
MDVSDMADRTISASALAVLRGQRWSGNVRELRNVIVQAAVRADGPILAEHVTAVIADRAAAVRRRLTPVDALRLYEQAGRNVSAAARTASLPRSTMRDLLKAAGRAASIALPSLESDL